MKHYFLLGIMSTLIFICVLAPAQLLGSLLTHYSEGRLSLAATEGSLWHGNAYLLVNAENYNGHPGDGQVSLGKLSWDTQALQLLIGRLSVNLTWNDSSPFWLTLDSSRLHVEHAVFNLPAETIVAVVPSLKAMQLGGKLNISCDNFSLTQNEVLGQIEIHWRQASTPLSEINPLGSYRARLDGEGEQLAITLETIDGSSLILQGNGQWTSYEGVHFDGFAEASASAETQLESLLRLMGNEATVGNGRYQLRF